MIGAATASTQPDRPLLSGALCDDGGPVARYPPGRHARGRFSSSRWAYRPCLSLFPSLGRLPMPGCPGIRSTETIDGV